MIAIPEGATRWRRRDKGSTSAPPPFPPTLDLDAAAAPYSEDEPNTASVRAPAERSNSMRFSVCIPDVDETVWRGVDESATVADDADAAEHVARELIMADPEAFRTFEGEGAVVLVRDRAFGGRTTPMRVSADMVPMISSRRIA